MILLNVTNVLAEFEFSVTELNILLNVLNEVIKEIDEWEFIARIGVKKSELIALMNSLKSHLTEVENDKTNQ